MAVCTMGSSVAWADNLIFDGTTLIWNTSEDNKSFADVTDAPVAFAAGDNVSFTGESQVSLGENITAGTVVIEKDADVTIDLGEFELDADRIELGGMLDMGDSLSIGKDSSLEITDAGAVLDSNLVLGEKGVLSVTGSGGSLNGHALSLQEGASLILTGAIVSRETTDADQDGELSLIVTPTGDGKTYTLLTGVDVLVDKTGNALAAGSYAIDDLFDSYLPGSGFWTGGTLVYAADGTLTLVRHNETVKDALEVTTRQTGNVYYSYYAGISFKNLTSTDSNGGAIYGSSSSTITLSNNGSVEFVGNTASSGLSSAHGGAIIGYGSITIDNNGSVEFVGNTASSGLSSAHGGAIIGYGSITIDNNGSVEFVGNSASSSTDYARGGAIYGGSSSTITLSNNGSVEFVENTASSGLFSAHGGAIYVSISSTISLSNNGSVVFEGNTAESNGGAIYGGLSSTITLSNNGSVEFVGNTASSSTAYAAGGAIYGEFITLSNNGSLVFEGNTASGLSSAHGGAIYKQHGSFSIQNNASVVFEKNYTLLRETLRLQSIYAYEFDEGEEMVVNFSAPKDGKIEFRDSIHISVHSNSASAFHLNNWYENDEGAKIAQTGDIIFTGADATAENLKAILAAHGINREATADEIRLSKTSEVAGTMQLHDGRLIVRDGAVIEADGITVHGSASGESTPTLWLDNGELSSYLNSSVRKNAISISGGSALRLSGQNTAMYSTLTLSTGSTLIIDVAATHAATAALTLDNGTLTLGGGMTLQLNAAEGLAADGRYMLLSGVSEPTDWASHITVSGGVWSIDDLSWVNNTLYLNYPTLTEATWNNASGDWVWNVDSSVNWEQHELNWAYRNGIGVIFGDEACGTVKLAGNLAPKSVLVNNSIGKDYVFSGTGSLTDSMRLTKDGTGKLTILTSNSYTGGTEIKGGVLVVDNPKALGTGEVVLNGGTLEIAVTGLANILANTGTSTLKVSNGKTHSLAGTIDNSGELTLEGLFDATALATAIGETHIDATGQEGNSGFLKTAGMEVDIMTGSGTLVNNGTVTISGTMVTLDSTGYGKTGAELQLGTYTIVDGTHSVEAILRKSTTANIILEAGTLTADASTDALTATGGIINMSDAIELGGSICGTELNVSAGKLTATLEGANTLNATGWNISQAITNNGTLTLTGTVDASVLATAIGETHIDATGQEGNSGFLKTAGKEVDIMTGSGTLVNNGTVSIDGTTVTLDDKGYGKTGVELQLGTYTIVDGAHSVEAILGKSATAEIVLEAGILTADASTDALTATGGIINMSDAIELGGSISGAVLNVSAGKLMATLEGENALNATDWSMSQAITNNGTLTLEGTVDASSLATHTEEMLVNTSLSESSSGFLKTAGSSVTIMSGRGTLDTSGAEILVNGQTVTLDERGHGQLGQVINYTQYTINGTDSEFVESIMRAAAGHAASTDIVMNGGELSVNANVTGNLSLTGTAYASVDAAASVFGDVVLDGGTLVLIGNKLTVNGKLDVESATDLLVRNYESEGLFTLISFGSFEGNLSDMNLVEQLRFSSKKTLLTTDDSVMMVVGDKLEWTGGNITAGVLEDMEISYKGDSNTAAEITGSSSVTVDSGVVKLVSDNRYTGGTVVNGGKLIAGHNNAFGSGDVTVNNGGTLDLSTYVVPNKVFMNGSSTLANANGASHIVLGGGSQVSFSNGFTLGSGKTLEVATGGATYTGALTLGGGTLELSDQLIVQGDVVFEAGKQTVIDISGWTAADDGTVLVDFGSSNSGYADGCLTLGGIAGDWELDFNTMTGMLTLVAVKEDFRPNLDRNQQVVYDTMKDIMAGGNPGGVLGQLGQNIIGTRDESELKRALDEISGREYATIMSSQIEGNLGHLRRLRASAGKGTPLGEYVRPGESVFSNKGVDKSDNKGATVLMAPSPVLDSRRIRAGVSAFHEQGEIESDSNGDGFERSETGAQLTMEYLVGNDFVLGMGLSHSRTKLTPAYGKRRDEDNTHVDLYGVYQSGSWSSITALGVGLHQHELGRTVAGMQTEAEADGLSVNFLQDLAYCVYADEEQGLEVFGAVESSFNKVDSFSENGAGNASLLVDEQDAWATDVTLGLRYNHTLTSLGKAPAGMFTLQGGVVASLGDTNADATVHFAGTPGYAFKQSAAERNRWGYSVGASVNLPVSSSTAVFGTAEAVLRNDSYTVDAQVGVKMAF